MMYQKRSNTKNEKTQQSAMPSLPYPQTIYLTPLSSIHAIRMKLREEDEEEEKTAAAPGEGTLTDDGGIAVRWCLSWHRQSKNEMVVARGRESSKAYHLCGRSCPLLPVRRV